MESNEILKGDRTVLSSMDGTFYLDTDVLDRALDFLEEVKKAGKRYVFLRIIRRKSPNILLTNWQKWGVILKESDHYIRGCDDSVSESIILKRKSIWWERRIWRRISVKMAFF